MWSFQQRGFATSWENCHVESFNGKFRAELLDREIFDAYLEAQVLVERWRHEYNAFRPRSGLPVRSAFARS